MSWENAIELINKAYEKDFENKAFSIWLTKYPYMDENNFISFEEYKKNFMQPTTNTLSSIEDTLKEVSEIRQLKARKEGEK
ncbi:hypothetical protein [Romboutsia sp.]|uniref:hypothetical protein n=1 Tax=Romboutsia sp. TaxID=1965302 RepID=UPI002BACE028|nr:hypothetical protein [Romboutsia sp.]HSQ88100.1 hypothetical protein [Romboutsia sp.]